MNEWIDRWMVISNTVTSTLRQQLILHNSRLLNGHINFSWVDHERGFLLFSNSQESWNSDNNHRNDGSHVRMNNITTCFSFKNEHIHPTSTSLSEFYKF